MVAARKHNDSRAAANGAALQPEHQEMMLKMPCDEAVFRADKMQNLNDRLVGRHCAARRKSHRQDRRGEHQDQDTDTTATAVPAIARMRSIQPR